MKSSLEDQVKQWAYESQTSAARKLRPLLIGTSNITQFLKSLATLSQEQQLEFKEINYSLRYQIFSKIERKVKKISVLGSDSFDLLKELLAVTILLDQRVTKLLFVLEKITDPYLFLTYIEDTIYKSKRYELHQPSQGLTTQGKIMLQALEKQVTILQNIHNKETNSVEMLRIMGFKENQIQFELALFSQIHRLLKQAHQQQPFPIDQEFYLEYINQTKKHHLLRYLFMIKEQGIRKIQLQLASSKIKQVCHGHIALENLCEELDSLLVNGEVFSYLQNGTLKDYQIRKSFWQRYNFYSLQGFFFVKYIPKKYQSLSSLKQVADAQLQALNEQAALQNTKNIIDRRLQCAIETIKAISSQKFIQIYDFQDTWRPITPQQKKSLIKLVIYNIHQCGKQSVKKRIKFFFSKNLRSKQFIHIFSHLLEEIFRWQQKSIKDFSIVTQILDYIIFEGTVDVSILDNPSFLRVFAKFIHRFFNYKQFITITNFIGLYLAKLVDFGMDMSLTPIQKFHLLKFEQAIELRRQIYSRQDQRDYFLEYLNSFPQCYQIFAYQAKTAIDAIRLQLQTITAFYYPQNNAYKVRQKFEKIINIINRYSIVVNEDLNQSIRLLLKTCGFCMYRYSRYSNSKAINGINGINIKQQIQRCLNNYEQVLDIDLFKKSEPLQYIRHDEPKNPNLQQFARVAGELNCYIQISNQLQIAGTLNQELMLRVFFKIEEIRMQISEYVINMLFQTQDENISFYIEQAKHTFKNSLFQQLKESYMSPIEDYIINYVIRLPVYSKIVVISEYYKHLQKIMVIDNNQHAFAYTNQIIRLQCALSKGVNVCFSNMQVNKQVIFKYLQKIYFSCNKVKSNPVYDDLFKKTYDLIFKLKQQCNDPVKQYGFISDSCFLKVIISKFIPAFFGFAYTRNEQIYMQFTLNDKLYRGRENTKRMKNQGDIYMMKYIVCFMRQQEKNVELGVILAQNVIVNSQCQQKDKRWFQAILETDVQTLIQFPPQMKYQRTEIYENIQTTQQQFQQLAQYFCNIRHQFKHTIQINEKLVKRIKSVQRIKRIYFKSITKIFDETIRILEMEPINLKSLNNNLTQIRQLKQPQIKQILTFSHLLSQKFINTLINNFAKILPSIQLSFSNFYNNFFINTLYIIQKLVPNKFSTDSIEVCKCIQTLLSIVLKITQRNRENVDLNVVQSLVCKLINNNYERQQIVYFFFTRSLQVHNYDKLVSIMHKLIDNEKIQKIQMEAHLKAHYLRIQQNTSSDTIFLTSSLIQFVDAFKLRYKDNVEQFVSVAQVFVKKTQEFSSYSSSISNSNIVFNRKHKLWFSQLAKMQFARYIPGKYVALSLKSMIDQIKNMPSFNSGKKQYNFLFAISQIIYSHPLILPSLTLDKPDNGDRIILQILIDFIANQTNSQRYQIIINFIVSMTLDHSIMMKLNDKTIFFSEYLSYLIIKKIIKHNFSVSILTFILNMIRLKRFNHMCTIKIDQKTDSLKQMLEKHLFYLNTLPDQNNQKVNNQIVCQVLFYIYKYEEIRRLNTFYSPVYNQNEDFLIINESLIPFQAIFYENDQIIIHKKYQVIKENHKGLKCDPQLSSFQYLSQTYGSVSFTQNSIEQILAGKRLNPSHNLEDLVFKVPREYMKSLSSKYHKEAQFSRIGNCLYYSEKADIFKKRAVDLISAIDPPSDNEYDLKSTIEQKQRKIIQKRQALLRPAKNHNHQTSRYAPQEFVSQQNANKDIFNDHRLAQLLNFIPEIEIQQNLNNSRHHSRQLSRARQKLSQMDSTQIEAFIMKINAYRSKFHDEGLIKAKNLQNLKDANQKRQYLTKILAEDQFRYRYQNLQQSIETIIDDFRSNNRLLYLQKYADIIEPYQLKYQTSLLYKRFSSESIDSNISRQTNVLIDNFILRSHKKIDVEVFSDVSQDSFDQIDQIQLLNYQETPYMPLPVQLYPKIDEELVILYVKMLYQCCDTTGAFQRVKKILPQLILVPILQNKLIQNKLINTLIYILRKPTKNSIFPQEVKEWNITERRWIVHSRQTSDKFIRNRIFQILTWVRHFCYYHNPQFLKNQISYEGLRGLMLQQKEQYENFFPQYFHAPYAEIIDMALEHDNYYLASSLLSYATQLPTSIMKMIIKQIKQPIQFKFDSQLRTNRRNPFQLFNSLCSLSKNSQFKQLFFSQFPLGQKYPKFQILSELLQTELYTKKHLMKYHLQTLKQCKQKNIGSHDQYLFLNKIYRIYNDEDIQQAIELKNYQDVHCQILNDMNANKRIIEKQPIIKILKHPNLLNFNMKQNFFYNSINSNKEGQDWRDQSETIKSERSIGIFYSAFKELRNKPNQFWKESFKVKFYDEQNQMQPSGGLGIQRQWYSSVTKQMLLQEEGLFELTPGNVYFFSKNCWANPLSLQYFQFIGKIVGLSFTNSTFYITPTFSKLIYKLLLDQKIQLDDVSQHYDGMKFKDEKQHLQRMKMIDDEAYFQGFTFTWERKKLLSAQQFHNGHYLTNQQKVIEHYKENDPDNPGQYFSRKEHKVKDVIQLKPNGAIIPLTLSNVHEYVELRKQQCIKSILDGLQKPIQAFKTGVSCVVDLKKLRIFNCEELRRVVEGDYKIDMQEFKKSVDITVDNPQNPMREWFYQCVQEMTHQQRSILLEFWNASPKMNPDGIAATGLKVLIEDNKKNDLLPRSQTCSHLLIIPTYTSKAILKSRLEKVIEQFSKGQLRQYD